MDIIFVKDLRIDVLIGVNAWERRIRQTISIDLEMGSDIRKAAATDSIADTLDYKSVSKRVKTIVEETGYQLVETLAEHIASDLMQGFSIPWLRISITKPGAVRGSFGVGLVIERGQRF